MHEIRVEFRIQMMREFTGREAVQRVRHTGSEFFSSTF